MSASYIHTKRKAGIAQAILKTLAVIYFLLVFAAIGYLWTCTQDRFVSNAAFKISKQDSSSTQAGLLELALPGLSDSGSVDSQIALGYITSADLLIQLEKEFDLFKHYTSPQRDIAFRLKPDALLEERLKYYRSRITSHFDRESGLTNITVDTFDPELSQKIASDLLKKSESFVNHINQNIANQQLEFVRSEVERTAKHVEDINKEVLTLQNEHNLISPDEMISANLKLVQEMRMENVKLEVELASILRDSPNSPRIEQIRSRIQSLNQLIDQETAKLSGPENDRLNQLLIQFKQLHLRLEFALRLRAGAEMLYEKNRVEAISQTRFFTVIQNPYTPEDVDSPRRWYSTASILMVGVMVFLVFKALAHSVFERA